MLLYEIRRVFGERFKNNFFSFFLVEIRSNKMISASDSDNCSALYGNIVQVSVCLCLDFDSIIRRQMLHTEQWTLKRILRMFLISTLTHTRVHEYS